MGCKPSKQILSKVGPETNQPKLESVKSNAPRSVEIDTMLFAPASTDGSNSKLLYNMIVSMAQIYTRRQEESFYTDEEQEKFKKNMDDMLMNAADEYLNLLKLREHKLNEEKVDAAINDAVAEVSKEQNDLIGLETAIQVLNAAQATLGVIGLIFEFSVIVPLILAVSSFAAQMTSYGLGFEEKHLEDNIYTSIAQMQSTVSKVDPNLEEYTKAVDGLSVNMSFVVKKVGGEPPFLRKVLLGMAHTMHSKKDVKKDKDSIKEAMKKFMLEFLKFSQQMSKDAEEAFLAFGKTTEGAPTTTDMKNKWKQFTDKLDSKNGEDKLLLANTVGNYIQMSMAPLEIGVETFIYKGKTAELPINIFNEEVEEVLTMAKNIELAERASVAIGVLSTATNIAFQALSIVNTVHDFDDMNHALEQQNYAVRHYYKQLIASINDKPDPKREFPSAGTVLSGNSYYFSGMGIQGGMNYITVAYRSYVQTDVQAKDQAVAHRITMVRTKEWLENKSSETAPARIQIHSGDVVQLVSTNPPGGKAYIRSYDQAGTNPKSTYYSDDSGDGSWWIIKKANGADGVIKTSDSVLLVSYHQYKDDQGDRYLGMAADWHGNNKYAHWRSDKYEWTLEAKTPLAL